MKFHPLLILFIILGAIFFLTGIVLLYKNLILIKKGSRVKGKIVNFSTFDKLKTLISLSRTKKLHFPIITFKTKENKEIQFESLVSSRYEPIINSEVDVIYMENQPEKAIVYSVTQFYLFPIIYLTIGLLFLLFIIF